MGGILSGMVNRWGYVWYDVCYASAMVNEVFSVIWCAFVSGMMEGL